MAKSIHLDKFRKLSLKVDIDKIAKANAEKCARDINDNIKSHGWHGDYANSWQVTERGTNSKQYWVHSTQYRLTHLLENGHLIVNKKEGVGWSQPIIHIRPAFLKARDKFVSDAKKVDIDLKVE